GVMFRTLVSLGDGDGKEFVNVSKMQVQSEREQIRAQKVDLEERKFKESLRSKLDAGLDALAKMFRENPEARVHFEKAREALGKAESGKEVATKNTESTESTEKLNEESRK